MTTATWADLDEAVRVTAPRALDAYGLHDVAAQLRALAPVDSDERRAAAIEALGALMQETPAGRAGLPWPSPERRHLYARTLAALGWALDALGHGQGDELAASACGVAAYQADWAAEEAARLAPPCA